MQIHSAERRLIMTINSEFNRDISFDIVERIGVIASYSTGWSKELNLVSWNGGAPKYDIRDWAPDHSHMSRGVTLHEKEMRLVCDLLRSRGRRHYVYGDVNGAAGGVDMAEDLTEPDETAQADDMAEA